MKKAIIITGCLLMGAAAAQLHADPVKSILDIKHSITDSNIVPPESFETQTRLLEENFYLKNYVVPGVDTGTTTSSTGTPSLYEERLKQLPTIIELPYNSVVGNYIDLYLTRRRTLVADMLALHSYYGKFFVEALEKEGMPLELQYLPVIESAINPNAVSRAGAAGLWQFMPSTAKGMGMEVNSLVDERRDPISASENAAKLLKQLYDIYGDWSLAIAAYNCGPGNVNKARRRAGGTGDFWEIYNYLPAETRGYVPAFIAANYVMNYYDRHGITPTVIRRHLTTDTVHVDKYVHFDQIAAVLDIPVEEIRMLNPQYRKDVIPGDYRPYALTLPTQQCLSFVMSEPKIVAWEGDRYARRSYVEPGTTRGSEPMLAEGDNGLANLDMAARQSVNTEVNNDIVQTVSASDTPVTVQHTVKKGENIREIAKVYGVSATDIKRWNNLRRGKVREGDVLTIETVQRTAPSDIEVVAAPDVAQVSARELHETVKKESPASASTSSYRPGRALDNGTSTSAKSTASTTKKAAATPKATSHKVKSGENLSVIARKYGTTVAAIQKANNLKGTNIQIGQSLKIPGKTGSKSTASSKKKRRR